jgi:hypothetical protein
MTGLTEKMADHGCTAAAGEGVERPASYLGILYAAVSSTPAWHGFAPRADVDRERMRNWSLVLRLTVTTLSIPLCERCPAVPFPDSRTPNELMGLSKTLCDDEVAS